ncbi:hypothetical protein PsorP6_007168 [Peronosclerospora sorghi]|uniref:Uncharacterized protein n=1 Tax=Peronosclerospora sorghi TaxID=230839 RepID=A0ACC0WAD7_9STRA|nr:hypothetical protein PsorP6_007168 [Peronosclerospora sorghi]
MSTALAKLFRQHQVNWTRAKSGTYTTLVKQRVQENVLLGKIIQILGCKTTSDVESTTRQFDLDLIRGGKISVPTLASEARVLAIVTRSQKAFTETCASTNRSYWSLLVLRCIVQHNVLVRV